MREDSDSKPIQNIVDNLVRLSNDEEAWKELAPSLKGQVLLLDTFETSSDELQQLQQLGVRVALFEDGCRLDFYPVDLVIDSAPGAEQLPYRGDPSTRFLLGATYAPLRREFLTYESRERCFNSHLLLTFGGSDPDDIVAEVLPVVKETPWRNITILLGSGYEGELSSNKSDERIRIVRAPAPQEIPEMFATADLAVASAGTTALELAFLGVPAMLIPLVDDQQKIAAAFADANAARVVQPDRLDVLEAEVSFLHDNPLVRERIAEKARTMIDSRGIDRIAEHVTRLLHADVSEGAHDQD
jgi:spore coat polysaccharide biosynthesis predicted glycosyltransferase SpsG